MSRQGAVILCGGRSSRMGRDKAMLPFGNELMLQRVVRIVGTVVPAERIVVVAASEQSLPVLSESVLITRDERPYEGPLAGLEAGLRTQQDLSDVVFVTSCDVPLLEPRLIKYLFSQIEVDSQGHAADSSVDIVVPRDNKFLHPLTAVYRTCVLETISSLLAEGERRPRRLFDCRPARIISVEELKSVDAELNSFRNMNTPEDYHSALLDAGYSRSDERPESAD
ncbi:MAG: molybdenum cofactor guanylyltransferase [Planctomyces sp.]|nr:molybdenum cofactor guanylyltransferase [Planctomyces sp.]